MTAPKTLTGRLHAGGSALDTAWAALALRDGIAPPTVGPDRVPAEYGLDLVGREPRELPLRAVLVLSRGRGGFNSALVLTHPDGVPGTNAPAPAEPRRAAPWKEHTA